MDLPRIQYFSRFYFCAFFILLGCMIGCSEKEVLADLLEQGEYWYDHFGTVYKFENQDIYHKFIYNEDFERLKSYKVIEDTLCIIYGLEEELLGIKVEDYDGMHLVLQQDINSNYQVQKIVEIEPKLELWRNLYDIIDTTEVLQYLSIKISAGKWGYAKEFSIDSTGRLEVHLHKRTPIHASFLLDGNIQKNIKQMIQLIPIEGLEKERYTTMNKTRRIEVDIKTNQVSTTICRKGVLPRGLDVLVKYVQDSAYDLISI